MKDPLQASAHAGSGILKLNSTQCRKGDAAEIHSPAACPTGNADGASATSDNTPVRGLAGRFLWSVADYGGGRALSFVATVYAARVLGLAGFGVYAIAVAFAQTATLFVDFGTTAYGIREIAQRVPDRPRILSTVTYLRLLTAVTGGSLCAAAIAMLPSLAEYRAAMLIACIYFITYGMTQEWFYAGSLMFRPIALSNLVRGATCLLLQVSLVRSAKDTSRAVLIYAATPAVSALYLHIYSIVVLRLNAFAVPRLRDIYHAIRHSLMFLTSSACISLFGSMPTYVLGIFGSVTQVGSFAAANRPIVVASSMVLPLSNVCYPLIAGCHQDPDDFAAAQRLFRHVVVLLVTPVTILLLWFGGPIIVGLYGPKYAAAVGIFRLMALVIPSSALRLTYSHPLLASGKEGVLATCSALGLGVTTAVALALVPVAGIWGAAIAAVSGEYALSLSCYFCARRYVSAGAPPFANWSVAFAGISMVAACAIPLASIPRMALAALVFAVVTLKFDEPVGQRIVRVISRRLAWVSP